MKCVCRYGQAVLRSKQSPPPENDTAVVTSKAFAAEILLLVEHMFTRKIRPSKGCFRLHNKESEAMKLGVKPKLLLAATFKSGKFMALHH